MSLQKIFRGCFQLKHAREQVSPVAGQGGRRAVWSTQTSAAQHRPVIGFTCSRNIRFKLGLLPICEARGVFTKHKDYFESESYVLSAALGHLLEITAPEEYEVKRGKWSFAHLPVI